MNDFTQAGPSMAVRTDVSGWREMSPAERRTAEQLLERTLVSEEELEKALAEVGQSGMRLGFCLVSMGLVEEDRLTELLAEQYGVPAVDLASIELDPKNPQALNNAHAGARSSGTSATIRGGPRIASFDPSDSSRCRPWP